MSDLNALTLAGARDKLVAKEITSVELTEACPVSYTHLRAHET